jgi:hypothetical protein
MTRLNFNKAELKERGFKPSIDFPDIWINSNGVVYSFTKKAILKPNNRNLVEMGNGSYLNVPKAILQAFTGQKIRKRANIIYVDGNKNNLSPQNIRYIRVLPHKPIVINQIELIQAIRCYFEVEEGFNSKSILLKTYLALIAENTGFNQRYKEEPYYKLFTDYLKINASFNSIARLNNIGVRDCRQIVNTYINELINSILSQLKKNILTLKPYLTKKSTNQLRKELEVLIQSI